MLLADDSSSVPQPISTLRYEVRAEFLGTFMMISLGLGVVAATKLDATNSDHFAQRQYVNTAWGLGVALGIMASFDLSGAHLNPAVTLHAVVFGGFPMRKAVHFVMAQCIGSALAALAVAIDYVLFRGSGSLSNFFCTAPLEGVTWANAFFDEAFATALLLLAISSITSGPQRPQKALVAGFVGAAVFGIGNAFGVQSGYALNPARDFGPRMCWLVLAAVYGHNGLWAGPLGGGYFFVPIVAPCVGALVAGSVSMLIPSGDELKARQETLQAAR